MLFWKWKSKKKPVLYLKTVRFFPAGTYYWQNPLNKAQEVDVFLVGGGAGGGMNGSGSGYTKTFRGSNYAGSGWQTVDETSYPDAIAGGRDGNAISVSANEIIEIIVGAGGNGRYNHPDGVNYSDGQSGGFSQFKNSNYRANGGIHPAGYQSDGAAGGSGGSKYGSAAQAVGASNGGNGYGSQSKGQGHTTRDFGENTGLINAGGGGGSVVSGTGVGAGGSSNYVQGSGANGSTPLQGNGGGGYGGGGGANSATGMPSTGGKGGDGTVLIRFLSPVP